MPAACITALEAVEGEHFLFADIEEGEADLSDKDAARLFIAEYDENRDGQLSLNEVIVN